MGPSRCVGAAVRKAPEPLPDAGIHGVSGLIQLARGAETPRNFTSIQMYLTVPDTVKEPVRERFAARDGTAISPLRERTWVLVSGATCVL